jgi:hypothetical protein
VIVANMRSKGGWEKLVEKLGERLSELEDEGDTDALALELGEVEALGLSERDSDPLGLVL